MSETAQEVASRYLTVDKQAELLRWAAPRVGVETWRADSYAMGMLGTDGRVVAVAVLNMFADGAAWVHFATDRMRNWASRGALCTFFFMAFREMGLNRLTARTTVDNIDMQILALKLGFRFEGVERNSLNGKDVVVFGMLARECGWIGEG